MKKVAKKLFLLSLALLLVIVAIYFRLSRNVSVDQVQNNLYSAESFDHAHGLAVDIEDPAKLYIATHNGLLVLINEENLYRIGKSQDDYMGFTPDPENAKVFFTSGHPVFGGNLGFKKSEDGGVTWTKISNGINGPVDFHAMAISPANPRIVYGWYRGLQRSLDGGKNWELLNTSLSRVIALNTHPTDENIVFAATASGLKQSKNKGETWEDVRGLQQSPVLTVAVNPNQPAVIIAFAQSLGLVKSLDGGESWRVVNESFDGKAVLYVAYNSKQAGTIFALTENNLIYKSVDEGDSWRKIR